MSNNKYIKTKLQRKEIKAKTNKNKLPEINTRAFSLNNPNRHIKLNTILPQHPVRNEGKTISRQISAAYIKSRGQTLSVQNSNKNGVIGFDNKALVKQRSKSVNRKHEVSGLSREEMIQRRESHLNTYFNLRKTKLHQITKQNKRIYVRINSQKSMYSSRHNRSTDSVSTSRLSHNSSRHSIQTLRKSIKTKINLNQAIAKKQEVNKINIESKDINKLQNTDVNTYFNIFCNHFNSNVRTNKKEAVKPQPMQKGKENNDYRSDGLGKILEQLEQKREPKKRQVFGRLI